MCPYTPLWKRGARGDFISTILKSPFIPLCQRGIKNPETEGLRDLPKKFSPQRRKDRREKGSSKNCFATPVALQ
jgi:hypothetical protein